MLYSRFRAFSFVGVKFMLKKWGKNVNLIFFFSLGNHSD